MPFNGDAGYNLTLHDLARRLDPNGKVARIVERMVSNEILQDMVTIEGNLPTGHQTTIRTGMPTTGWKILYKGTPASKSSTSQVTDSTGILEAYGEVDEDTITLNGNMFDFRLSESRAFIDQMNRDMARALFWANTVQNPEEPMGLAMRYNTLNPDVPISENVFDCGGEEDDELTSIWLINWGQDYIHAIYPKGSELGLQHNDMGKEPRETVDEDTKVKRKYYAYVDQYKWKIGWCVRDWRHGARICNIPWKKLSDPDVARTLLDCMIDAEEAIGSLEGGRPAWYMNRRIRAAMRKGILRLPTVELNFDNVNGHSLATFDGIPIRRVDALAEPEERVTADVI